MAQVEMNHQKFIPRCIKHEDDLLPLFCRDCNCLMCSDCITTDHVGHNICKISDVAEFHQKKLEKVLECSDSMSLLEKMLQQLQQKQINLAKDTENLICRISEREEEIIQRVKLWSKKLIGNANNLKERRGLSLKHDENVINALLHFEELSTEMDTINIVATYLHCEVERLLPSKMEFTEEGKESDAYKFEVRYSGEDLDASFGKLNLHNEQESSSDVCSVVDENASDSEDDSIFYECHEKSISRIYQTSSKTIVHDIVVFHERRIFILSQFETLVLCDADMKEYGIKHSIIAHNVYQIAKCSSTGELLFLLNNKKEIKRLSTKNTTTTFVFTKAQKEMFCALNNGGNQAYACVLLRCYKDDKMKDFNTFICLLNEYGVTLKKYLYPRYHSYHNAKWRLLPAQFADKDMYLVLCEQNFVDQIVRESNEILATYLGAIGTSPWSQFSPTDIAIDDKDNILLVVRDDNAIHLLDKSLKFQRLILSEEDGLHSPRSVTLDNSGYLWVGCQDGKIHAFNYQYLLETERSARYH